MYKKFMKKLGHIADKQMVLPRTLFHLLIITTSVLEYSYF